MQFHDSIARIAIVAVLVAAGLGGSSWGWSQLTNWQEGRLATQLSLRVAAADDTACKAPLRQLAQLGLPALDELVTAASSDRAAVATVAQHLIDEKLENWRLRQMESDFELNTHASALANALAKRIHEFGPNDMPWAEGLALAMIKLADGRSGPDLADLLQNCSRILEKPPPERPPIPSATKDKPAATPQVSIYVAPVLKPDSVKSIAPTVPHEIRESSTQPPSAPDIDRRPVPPPTTIAPRDIPNWSPRWQAEKRAKPLPLPTPSSSVVIADRPRHAPTSMVIDVPTPAEMARLAISLRNEPTEELLNRLPTADFYRAGVIRAILRQRGVAETELELAKRLSSDRVDDRLQLIDDLSVLPASTARRWLRRMLSDESAGVRLQALTAMATTSDPQLYDLAREMALHDGDPRIAELASRIMRQVR